MCSFNHVMYHVGIKVLYFFIAWDFMPLFVFEQRECLLTIQMLHLPLVEMLRKIIWKNSYISFERDPRK